MVTADKTRKKTPSARIRLPLSKWDEKLITALQRKKVDLFLCETGPNGRGRCAWLNERLKFCRCDIGPKFIFLLDSCPWGHGRRTNQPDHNREAIRWRTSVSK